MSGRVRWYMCPYAVNGRACETQIHVHVHVPVPTMDGYTKRTYVHHRRYSSMMTYFHLSVHPISVWISVWYPLSGRLLLLLISIYRYLDPL